MSAKLIEEMREINIGFLQLSCSMDDHTKIQGW